MRSVALLVLVGSIVLRFSHPLYKQTIVHKLAKVIIANLEAFLLTKNDKVFSKTSVLVHIAPQPNQKLF